MIRRSWLPLLLLTLALPARADEKLLPIPQQVLLLLKTLTYERTLMQSSATNLQIGYVYDLSEETSRRQFADFEQEFQRYTDKTLRGHAVSLLPLPIASARGGELPASAAQANVLYIPALDASFVPRISAWTRERKILSVTPIESYVEGGFSLGLVIRNGRTGVTINRAASDAEGMAWADDFLRLCRVIG